MRKYYHKFPNCNLFWYHVCRSHENSHFFCVILGRRSESPSGLENKPTLQSFNDFFEDNSRSKKTQLSRSLPIPEKDEKDGLKTKGWLKILCQENSGQWLEHQVDNPRSPN